MIKYILGVLLIIGLLVGVLYAGETSKMEMKCDVVEDEFFNIYRCENSEIVCYFMINRVNVYTNLDCKFK